MLLSVFITFFYCISSCWAQKIKHLVVFGDSNADTGNFQRWTNGPLWSEHVAVGWNATLDSFAYTGATCDRARFSNVMRFDDSPSVKDQIEMYYRQPLSYVSSETVYAIWVGSSDIYKSFLQRPNASKLSDLKFIVECITKQVMSLRKTYKANQFIVFNAMPMEHMPFYQDAEGASGRGEAAKEFNKLLSKEVARLNKYHHALVLDLVDTHSLLTDMMAKPKEFGFKDTSSAYLGQCQGHCEGEENNYVWWDRTHLTGGAHYAIANSILLAGSFSPSKLVDLAETKQALSVAGSSFKSPIYKSPPNIGLLDQLSLKEETKAKEETEQKDKESPIEEEGHEEEQEQGENRVDIEEEEEAEMASSHLLLYLVIVILGFIAIALWAGDRTPAPGDRRPVAGRWHYSLLSSFRLRRSGMTPARTTEDRIV
ncbi:GDSL-like Lipase/Acylhydrolase-domain-containing protein [Spinellus fusiger]|nr:GDSL-like Lipase/Acylhydrolase-domain-containing protein [Spinellus fusiger]